MTFHYHEIQLQFSKKLLNLKLIRIILNYINEMFVIAEMSLGT